MPKNGTSSLTNHSNLARRYGHHSALRFGKCPVPNHFHRHPVNLRHQAVPSGDRAYRTFPHPPDTSDYRAVSFTFWDARSGRLHYSIVSRPVQPRTHACYHCVRVRCTASGILTTMYLYLTLKAPYSLSCIIFGCAAYIGPRSDAPVTAIKPLRSWPPSNLIRNCCHVIHLRAGNPDALMQFPTTV